MRKTKRVESTLPAAAMSFEVPLRTCSKAKNRWGHSPEEWRPGQLIRIEIFNSTSQAKTIYGGECIAVFCPREIKMRRGVIIGTITTSLEHLSVSLLVHECFHAIVHWAAKYRPKKINPTCAEEMMAYGLANLISDCQEQIKSRGHVLAPE